MNLETFLCNASIISADTESVRAIMAVSIGAGLAYKYAIKQQRKKIAISAERGKRNALQKCSKQQQALGI